MSGDCDVIGWERDGHVKDCHLKPTEVMLLSFSPPLCAVLVVFVRVNVHGFDTSFS